jgi:hypothetical protein
MGQRNRLRERVALPKAVTGKTGYEEVAGQTPISVIRRSNLSDPYYICDRLDFEFYDLVLWLNRPTKPSSPRLARWLGISHRVGSELSYWLNTERGRVIEDQNQTSRISTVDSKRHLTVAANFIIAGDGESSTDCICSTSMLTETREFDPKNTKVRQTQRTTTGTGYR